MTPWAVGLGVAGTALTAAAWCVRDVRRSLPRGPARRAWTALVTLGLVTVPLLPGVPVPVRVTRTHYAGEDLLSAVPVRTRTLARSTVVPGLSAVRTSRTVQGDALMSETRTTEARIPLVLLAVVLAWVVRRRFARRAWSGEEDGAGHGGRGSRSPEGEGGGGGGGPRRMLVVVLTAGLLAGGCGDGGPPPPSVAEVRLMELMEMRHTGEVDGILDLFDPMATYEDHTAGVEYRGAEEISAFLAGLHGWATGVFLDVVRVHPARDRAVAEWILEGVQSGPIPGWLDTATQRRFHVEGVTVVEVQGGVIVRASDWADMVPLLLDLGSSVTLPGGSVLALPDDTGN